MALGGVGAIPLQVTEDTPPDLLAGCMDLQVVLPAGSVARISVDRSTPMMDLLVQLARAHKMAPAGHTLQALGIDGDSTPLHYQPSTPVGALDVFTVKIVPKTRSLGLLNKRAAPRPAPAQPFEQTFRLQVHLPRNQLFVTRASRATVLGDIRQLACGEKNLDPNKYELRHPANLEQRLSPEWTLGECGLTEVALVAVGGRHGPSGQPDIMALRRQDEKRREAARAGQFGFLMSHTMTADGSVSSVSSGSLGGRSTSPAPSDGSSADRSTSPPQMQTVAPPPPPPPPNRPGRKRRPAPKPPVLSPPREEVNNNINKESSAPGTVISHSRNSSDSSGYHEASVLSESPEGGGSNTDSLPGLARRSKLPPASCGPDASSGSSQPSLSQSQALSRSMTSLAMPGQGLSLFGQARAHHVSTSALSTAGQRKKKAPPPPPPCAAAQDKFLKTQSLERQTPIVAGDNEARSKSSTLPPCSSPRPACAPVGAPGGSSSCSSRGSTPTQTPTPTPSLSETSSPVVAPRPVPRTVCPASQATGSVPRPRSRKPPAPTPPASPQKACDSPIFGEKSSLKSSASVDETDNVSEASSSVFDDVVVYGGTMPVPACETRSVDGVESDKRDADRRQFLSEREESDEPHLISRWQNCNSLDGAKEVQCPARGVPPSDFLRTLNVDGEEVDSGAEEVSQQISESAERLSPSPQIDEKLSHVEGNETDSMKMDKLNVERESLQDIKVPEKSNAKLENPASVKEVPGPSQLPPPPQLAVEEEWEYRLPSPPSAFRDSRSHSPTVTDFDTVTLAGANLCGVQPSPGWEISSDQASQTDQSRNTELSEELCVITERTISPDELESLDGSERKSSASPANSEALSHDVGSPLLKHGIMSPAKHTAKASVKETLQKSQCQQLQSVATESAPAPVSNVSSTLNHVDTKNLAGSAAVLNELHQVLAEQRSSQSTQPRPVLMHSESAPTSALINNFSFATYTRPHSTEGMPPPEVRPSLVLARRSSFSNSNGNLNAIPKFVGLGVRRTTSHATLVTPQREACSSSSRRSSGSEAQSIENLASNVPYRASSVHKGARNGQDGCVSQLSSSMGRAISEMDLNAGFSMAPLEPELLKEFMEWRQQRQQLMQKEKSQKNSTQGGGTKEIQKEPVLEEVKQNNVPQASPIIEHVREETKQNEESKRGQASANQKEEPEQVLQSNNNSELHGKLQSSDKATSSVELQSPQVLRTILPQLSQNEDESCNRSTQQTKEDKVPGCTKEGIEDSAQNSSQNKINHEKQDEPIQRVLPWGPPSIQLSTWSERPKRQVSLKMDRDYWVGMGGAALRKTQPAQDKVDRVEPTIQDSASQPKNTVQRSQTESAIPPAETVQRLTRQFIAHATPCGFRRTVETAPSDRTVYRHSMGSFSHFGSLSSINSSDAEKSHMDAKIITSQIQEREFSPAPEKTERIEMLEKPSLYKSISSFESAPLETSLVSKGDPSRIPIVRSVELKKPVQQQRANSSVVYFSPAATSSVSAKCVPVSTANVTPPVKKFTSVVDISGPAGDKAVSGSSISQPVSNGTSKNATDVHVNGFPTHTEPKKKLPMPVVKGFKLAQGPMGRQLSAPAATPPPPNPPPPPSMPVLRKVTARPSSLPPRVQDPREQLLDAIRNFGGRTNLRPT